MSFGRRETAPSGHHDINRAPVVVRRGGYPLSVVAVAVSSFAAVPIMALIPYFNPTRQPLVEVTTASVMAVLNVTLVAALVLLVVDLVLRAFKVTAVWAYALATGFLAFGLCFLLASALGSSAVSLAFLAILVFLPALVGGSVLGCFRTRA